MSRFQLLNERGEVAARGHIIARDTTTGLEWTVAEQKPKRWTAAKAWAEKLDLAGGGWRLPTVEELFCLADRTRFDPAIDADAFPGCNGGWYWSSTIDAVSPADCAWCVSFHGGGSLLYLQNDGGLVRAVRAENAALRVMRRDELQYVAGTLKLTRNMPLGNARYTLEDLMAWAKNRSTAEPPERAAVTTSVALNGEPVQ